MYYVLSGVLALLVSLKYTKSVTDAQAEVCEKCCAKIELLEKKLEDNDKESLKKVMTTVLPIAKAVNRLNNEVGVQ